MKCDKCGKLLHGAIGVVSHVMPSISGRIKHGDANIFWCKNPDCKPKTIYNWCRICKKLYNSEQKHTEFEPQCPYCRKELYDKTGNTELAGTE